MLASLRKKTITANLPHMKLCLVIAAQVLLGALLGVGLYLSTAKGSHWLLVASLLVYSILFAKIGCLPKQSH